MVKRAAAEIKGIKPAVDIKLEMDTKEDNFLFIVNFLQKVLLTDDLKVMFMPSISAF